MTGESFATPQKPAVAGQGPLPLAVDQIPGHIQVVPPSSDFRDIPVVALSQCRASDNPAGDIGRAQQPIQQGRTAGTDRLAPVQRIISGVQSVSVVIGDMGYDVVIDSRGFQQITPAQR